MADHRFHDPSLSELAAIAARWGVVMEEASSEGGAPEGGAPVETQAAASVETTPAVTESAPVPSELTPEYVHSLREEAAGYRTKLKTYDDTFQGYTPDEVENFLGVARALRDDPVAAADWFEEVAKNIKAGMTQPEAEAAATADAAAAGVGQTAPEDKPLTKAEMEQYLTEREQKRADLAAQEAALEAVHDDLKKFGYDPEGADGVQVMWLAVNKTNGDIEEAHKIVQAERQAIIDKYLEEKRAQAKAAGVAPAAAQVISGERAIKTLDDGHAAMRARLGAQQIGR